MDVFWTEYLFDLLGVDYDEEPPLDEALDIYHEEDRPIVENAVEAALDSSDSFDIEVRVRRPDGEIRWLRVQGTPALDDGDVVTLRGAVQDATDRKRYEQKLERKNTRLNQSASTITHDLLDAVEHAHERMRTLIADLLTLSREGDAVTDPEFIGLGNVAEECWANVEMTDATLITDVERPFRPPRVA